MKKIIPLFASALLCASLLPASAQPGPAAGTANGPQLGGALSKLFGDNQAFSANLEFQTTDNSGKAIMLPGKMCFDRGNSRFECNLADMQGGKMSPEAAEHMKAMGLDQTVTISRQDKKVAYIVYPGMQSYVEKELPANAATNSAGDYKTVVTEIGKDTVDGHPCVKNKVVVTDKENVQHEFNVWNATDLKNFPVKIQTTESGSKVTMLFKNVSLAKPDAKLFDVPADYTKYDSVPAMMQQQMMKRMGGGFPGMGH